MRKFDKQRKISEYLFQLRDKTKRKRIDLKFDEELLNKSPIFVNPQLYIKKFRMIDEANTLQGYRPLETSAIAHCLTSPPRMTHGSRTVVPRDFLISLRVMQHDFTNSTKVPTEPELMKKSKKEKRIKLEYMMVPFHPKDAKVSEDPVIYYPNSLDLYKTYLKVNSSDIAPVHKFSFSSTLYPNIKNTESVAWNRQTSMVIKMILMQNILNELYVYEAPDQNVYNYVTISRKTEDHSVFIKNGDTVLDGTQYDDGLVKILEQKIPTFKIPVSSKTGTLIRNLVKYTLYING